ncbi:MAG: triphosphoribosyl-dephospho-CoA synthase [Methanothrix sp.]|nr:MAG: triphosphoribosyl-dephospho-CoA synthase [Methanothrix sp.]
MSPDYVAQCAELAMLLELSSSPKPGNVDRCHDFSEIKFSDFLVSAVSAFPVFRQAAQNQGRVGSLILHGVQAWGKWKLQSNTHFGSLVLMIPLACAAGAAEVRNPEDGADDLQDELARILQLSSVEDAVDFYRAFLLAGARVADVDEFSLKDPNSELRLRQEGRTLLDLMKLSQGHDLIAREWSTNFERSFRLADRLKERIGERGPNDGIVLTFLEALHQVPDSLICAKFGCEKAAQVSVRAGEAMRDENLEAARILDRELLAEDINPGSTADLIAASLFISLLRGLRF